MLSEVAIFENADETMEAVLAAVAVCVLGYALLSGCVSDGPYQYNLSRALNLRRRRGMPGWPAIEATVTRVTEVSGGRFWLTPAPDFISVTFDYEVGGVQHTNRLIAAFPRPERYWVGVTAHAAIGEKVLVRYDPQNPADSVPVEETWHGWKLRTGG